MTKAPISSYNTMGGNPFHDERYTTLMEFYDEPHYPQGHPARDPADFYDFVEHGPSDNNAQPTYRHNGMSHSLSEGNVGFRGHVGQQKAGHARHRRLASDEILISYSDDEMTSYSLPSHGPISSSSSSRGRSELRTPSPQKLEDIKEASRSVEELSMYSRKRHHSPVKQLFGEHGWFGVNRSTKDLLGDGRRKKTGLKELSGKIKERVEKLTPDMPKIDFASIASRLQSPSKSKSKFPIKTKFYVSLSPPIQARLYSEMELMIVATANEYLQGQQSEGRMSIEALGRVLENWMSKNRPQVIEFLFDQATQRELVLLNMRTFRFFGQNGENLIAINRMMQQWKALARDMSVRNFCTPDAVVRKNLVDAYKVLEMLGAPMVTFLAFVDIKERVEGIIAEETNLRREYEKMEFGIEKQWEPPKNAKVEEAGLNPFA